MARPWRVVSISNQKGGVGKTTTAINLGASLASKGKRVLVVDLDPQGNATSGLGIDRAALQASVYHAMIGELPLSDTVVPTNVSGLELAPSTVDLTGVEVELVSALARESRLRTALAPVRQRYDFVLVDCPPSLGLLTVNALTAADAVLIPLQCEYYALEGLGQLLHTIDLVRASLNSELEVMGILLTMFDARTTLAHQVASEVRRHFPELVFRTVIPRNVRLSEAPSHGLPAILYDVASRGAQGYLAVAEEFLPRIAA